MIKKMDDNSVVYYSNTHEAADILDIFINRDGNLFARITCPKDRVVTVTLGKIEVPNRIKKLGQKIFRSHSSHWLAENIDANSMILRFGAGNSYQLTFKLFDKKISRNGKFRLHSENGEIDQKER